MFASGLIIHPRHVHRNTIFRVNGPGRSLSTPGPHLFLDGKYKIQIVVRSCQPLHHQQQHQAGHPVVQIRRDHPVPRPSNWGIVYRRIPNLDQLFCLLKAGRAHVYEQVSRFQRSLILVLRGTDQTAHAILKAHWGIKRLTCAHSPQSPHMHEALFVYVGCHQTDGIHMSGEHNPGPCSPFPAD